MAGPGPEQKPTPNGLFTYPTENADPWWSMVDDLRGQWPTMERLFIAIWFEIGDRPVVGEFAGDFIRVGALPANPEHCCPLGINLKGKFYWRGSAELGMV